MEYGGNVFRGDDVGLAVSVAEDRGVGNTVRGVEEVLDDIGSDGRATPW